MNLSHNKYSSSAPGWEAIETEDSLIFTKGGIDLEYGKEEERWMLAYTNESPDVELFWYLTTQELESLIREKGQTGEPPTSYHYGFGVEPVDVRYDDSSVLFLAGESFWQLSHEEIVELVFENGKLWGE